MIKIFLIGFMGSGKTSVGRSLSEKTGLPFRDLDSLIEEKEGKSVFVLFKEKGESYFRSLETKALKEETKREEPLILSTGGGILTSEENFPIIREGGFSVYLRVQPETVCKRLSGDHTRPLLSGDHKEEKVRRLLSAREKMYEEAADFILDSDQGTPDLLADRVLAVLRKRILFP